jgi:hypothetical protein
MRFEERKDGQEEAAMAKMRQQRRENLRFWELTWASTFEDRYGEKGDVASELVTSRVKVYDEFGGGWAGADADAIASNTGYVIRCKKSLAREIQGQLQKLVGYPVELELCRSQEYHLEPGGRRA